MKDDRIYVETGTETVRKPDGGEIIIQRAGHIKRSELERIVDERLSERLGGLYIGEMPVDAAAAMSMGNTVRIELREAVGQLVELTTGLLNWVEPAAQSYLVSWKPLRDALTKVKGLLEEAK